MKGLKKKDTPILKGYQLSHNFIRPHMALDGKTPAQVARLDLQLEGIRWKMLIERAVKGLSI